MRCQAMKFLKHGLILLEEENEKNENCDHFCFFLVNYNMSWKSKLESWTLRILGLSHG